MMNLATLTCLGLLLIGIHCEERNSKRVIGGKQAPETEYQWAVSIKGDLDEIKGSGACGASIINTEGEISWLITAAHCFFIKIKGKRFDLTNPKLWHARIGLRTVDFYYKKHGLGYKIREKMKGFFRKAFKVLFNKNGTGVAIGDIHIKKIFVHPNYKPSRLEYDIALMKLRVALPIDQLKGVNTINLPDGSLGKTCPAVNSTCDIVGWGCTKLAGGPNKQAKLASLTIWDNKKCVAAFGGPIDLNKDHEFCAGYHKMKYGLCPGDSGSGLACKYKGKWTVAGIVSAAHSIKPGEYPALFTRVSWFIDWISNIVKNN